MTDFKKGTLFLVSTPIGNKGDITLRALEILRSADIIVCEEIKQGRRLLSSYEIQRDLIPLNEHNEDEMSCEIFQELKSGKNVALISDAGAPLFADPGSKLTKLCIDSGIKVTSVPGANSLIPALQLSGFQADSFLFVGWLSPKKDIRRKELMKLKNETRLMIFLEAPYRIRPLLSDLNLVFGSDRKAAAAFDLTAEKERIYRGSLSALLNEFERNPRKGEFVLILEGR